MSNRLTKRDLRTINSALALYDSHVDDDYPDASDDSPEADKLRAEWDAYLEHVQSVRRKVWARIDNKYDDGRPGL